MFSFLLNAAVHSRVMTDRLQSVVKTEEQVKQETAVHRAADGFPQGLAAESLVSSLLAATFIIARTPALAILLYLDVYQWKPCFSLLLCLR